MKGAMIVVLVAGFVGAAHEAPSFEELSNAAYSGLPDFEGPVRLEKGRWDGEPFAPGGASRPSVSLAPGFRLAGDLDGDGNDEAVVVLAQSAGGSGTVNYLAVVGREGPALRNLATVALGDRVAIRSARIASGTLHVNVLRAGAGDALCCPGELAELAWTLADGRLVEAPAAGITGRLSLDAIGGGEWVLRAWNTDELAPADPALTLEYRDGRFVGASGCNRYFAPTQTTEIPGEVKVGPLAATRRSCPDPGASLEKRFLGQLAGARKFGFLLGRLALTYEQQDGAVGVMLFEPRAASDGAGAGDST